MSSHWILGPGAIGRLLAHSLSPVAAVSLIGRRALPAQQTITTPEGEQRIQDLSIFTPDQLAADTSASPAFVHITTKAMAAEAALGSIADVIPPTTPLVLWQNGFLAQPRLAETWPGPVLCASTTEGAYLTSDDEVVHAGRGQTLVGDLHNRHETLAEALAATLTQSGLATLAVSDIRSRLWQKLAVNAAINPLVALLGVRNGELRNEAYAHRVESAVREIAAIMQAEGIAPPEGQQGEKAWLSLVWKVVENTANNKASMLQDVEAKRPTERGAILGPMIASAQRNGVPSEVLQSLDDDIAALEIRYRC
ncbi:ketopantoate reductase family protein [Vreelandella sulfidaeris]|uniref:ketopantoate reductase family protein n=1 Tax=Vreelandella sulfidaeris TaxID=115553 RepID=UPI0035EFFF4B